MSESLTDIIDRMVQERTFGLEGLEAVKLLKEKATAQTSRIETLERQVENGRTELGAQQARNSELSRQVMNFQTRETELVERERKIFDHEKTAAVATAQSAAYRDVVGMAFRNTTVREHVLSNNPQWVPGQHGNGPMLMNAHDSKTFERTAE
jgi:hypothetical protein